MLCYPTEHLRNFFVLLAAFDHLAMPPKAASSALPTRASPRNSSADSSADSSSSTAPPPPPPAALTNTAGTKKKGAAAGGGEAGGGVARSSLPAADADISSSGSALKNPFQSEVAYVSLADLSAANLWQFVSANCSASVSLFQPQWLDKQIDGPMLLRFVPASFDKEMLKEFPTMSVSVRVALSIFSSVWLLVMFMQAML